MVGYYYSALVCEDQIAVYWSNKRYWKDVMHATKETFQKLANRLGYIAPDENEVQHPVWIVPTPIFVMQNVNDTWYLPENEVLQTNQVQKAPMNDVDIF